MTKSKEDESQFKEQVTYSDDGKTLIKCNDKIINEYKINDGCEVISDSAFKDCEALIDIYIPDSVKYIGSDAFFCCGCEPGSHSSFSRFAW